MNLKTSFVSKIGWILFIGSLIFYSLLKLPFNFSVLCTSSNEGFYFAYGQHLLNGNFIKAESLFIAMYALILKIFGFGTMSIIAAHFVQTLVVVLNWILVFLIVRKLTENIFFSGVAVLILVLLQITPIGQWGQFLELESAFSLEAEYFCIFFSLASIYLLIAGINSNLLSFLAGLLAACSVMFKTTGAVITLSVICWLIYLLLFDRRQIKFVQSRLIPFVCGFFLSILFFNVIIYFIHHDLSSFWRYQFSVGSYSREFLYSPKIFFSNLFNFMTRYVPSLSNFLLFFFAFLFIIWGLIRILFVKGGANVLRLFFPLLSIWGMGSICAVLAPGGYGSYYYLLVWPPVAILWALGLMDIKAYLNISAKQNLNILVFAVVILFFIQRLCTVFPTYLQIAKVHLQANIFSQKQSWQDPVLPYNPQLVKRPPVLQIADLINSYLPNKIDTFYAFHFTKWHQTFSPSIYIYSKRLSTSTVFCDFLHYKLLLNERLKTLKDDFTHRPPKIIVMPRSMWLEEWQINSLSQFFKWLDLLIKQKYKLKDTFNYTIPSKPVEIYDVYERM